MKVLFSFKEQNIWQLSYCNKNLRAEEMGLWLRVLVALPEDQGLILTIIVVYTGNLSTWEAGAEGLEVQGLPR